MYSVYLVDIINGDIVLKGKDLFISVHVLTEQKRLFMKCQVSVRNMY